jgi:hypothetical protein
LCFLRIDGKFSQYPMKELTQVKKNDIYLMHNLPENG